MIAEASLLRGMGSWRIGAYRTTGADAVTESRSFAVLKEAHEAADALVRRHFRHACRTGMCGRWLRWPDE
jgi:hypothetical protein